MSIPDPKAAVAEQQVEEYSFPLTYAQSRLWFLQQFDPESTAYLVPWFLRIRGRLQPKTLHSALTLLLERHESLRTRFEFRDGQPRQIVASSVFLPMPIEDISDFPDPLAEAQRLSLEETEHPLDLSSAPLLRTRLLRLSNGDHVLLLTTHHIIIDGSSRAVFGNDLASFYDALAAGETPHLQELSIQYADYAVWERDEFSGQKLDRYVNFWREALAGAPALLELSTDRPRPAVETFRGASHFVTFPKSLSERLVEFSKFQQTTLLNTMLAGFNALLSRYSGQTDIPIGVPIANRNRVELEPLIGFFTNTLVLRTRFEKDTSFLDLLKRVRQTSIEALSHSELPFEKLVEELNPERSLSHNPLFQVMLSLRHDVMESIRFPQSGLEMEFVEQGGETGKFDLSFHIRERDGVLTARVEYNTDLFDQATIERMLNSYKTLLEAAVAAPSSPVSELSILAESDRNIVITGFNETLAEFRAVCLHQLFSEQVQRTPSAIAIVDGERRISFAELDHRANRVAYELIERGVGPDMLVGIYFERSAEMLVAILGVLKAGGAYVPLDPNYPAERIEQILEGARATIILSQASVASRLPSETPVMFLSDADCQPETAPSVSVQPHQLAYVLFTSGSTGKPKGVAIEHRSAATFIQWALTVFTPQQLSGVLLSTSVCFDLSIFEIFAPLSCGGEIILVENALSLPDLIARHEVTLINAVPSAIAELLRCNGVPPNVRTVNLAGEALSADLVDKIYRQTSVERVFNLYGPTEDTTYSTYTLVRRGGTVTIGKPIANTQAFILDSHFKPQPIGVPGELFLAGAGLARGYLNRPDLTAERFVPNPFDPGSRMYKTGDLCRWLPNGEIEYLGRLDHQVKLRGFRIELGEIENTLDSHPGVLQSVVIAREDHPGDKRLVAYIVVDPEYSAVAANSLAEEQVSGRGADRAFSYDLLRAEMEHRLTLELHTFLVGRLPQYMVPTAFMLLSEMPLGTTGKVDRKALPAPGLSLLNAEYVAPQSDLERDLAAIWADLLHIERVGTRDNFFEVGGHSLLAMQVVSRVRQTFDVELPLRAIFEDPTVIGLTRRIMLLRGEGRVAGLQMSRVSRSEELAASYAQQRLWFLNRLEPGLAVYNIATVHRLRGALEIPRLERAIKHVIARQESLRTTFVMGSSGQPIEVIHPELAFSLVVLDSNGDEAAAREWIGAEAQRPFDLAVGPLLRATLVRLGADDHVLEIIMHHIVSDGWSHGVLWHEIKAAYEDVALPELEILYADYAAWQRDYLASGVLEDQLSYWRTALAGAPAALELPLDHTRPALQTYNGKRLVRVLPKQLLESIRKLSHQEGVTLFMAMLAAWDVLLARYTGQGDIVIGTPIAGRNRAELEPIIGFFVNTLVMRTDMSGAPSFREVLNRVRETTLGAYANQDVPFERLVEELKPVRDMSRIPLFQVMIALFNKEETIAESIGGVKVSQYGSGRTAAKFDLSIDMAEQPDGLFCSLVYNTDLFEAATAERMLSHFEVLLRALVADPATCCAEASILSSEEQRQLSAWNATEHDVPRHVPLHRHFEAAAAATPQAVAVRFEDAQLSYDELDRRANQLAQYLGARGIGPGSLVGVCAERSLEMVIALLGILKAGAGYVPIDPEYPLARLQSVIEDTATPLLLTQEHLLEVLPAFAGAILCLDRDWKVVAEFPATALAQSVSGKDVAYAIYTSGSTGKPKGVPNTHEGIVNRLLWMQHEYGLTTADRILQKTPYSFDVSVWEFFWPLMQGAGLVMARPQGHKDPDYLIELIQQQGITTMHFVPSMLRVFLEARGVEQCSSLKRVICSGEALPHDLTVRFFERLPGVELHNLYGPTEAAVDVTYFQCRPDDERSIVPIGRPVWNTQIHILSAEGQVQPVGVPGELYIAGIQLARGYLNRPDLTAERFVPNPFDPGSRMYKTGDLCRWLADGNIEYLGRLDHQVKVRGFRIELGEIEATLDSHPGVLQSVVVAREDHPGDKRLVAYVVADPEYRSVAADSLAEGQVSQWGAAFDETYRGSSAQEDPAFNIVGWNSSYDGRPIDPAEMRLWADSTAERILRNAPKRVWEIGCGTGLLLFRIAPHCSEYFGTDISVTAIELLREELARPVANLPQVSLAHCAAHEVESHLHPGQKFDAIVINSVAQYFPSIRYLLEVMEEAAKHLAPNGTIFLGDIRSFPLLEAFHTSVELWKAEPDLTTPQLWRRVQRQVRQDSELTLDPEFFTGYLPSVFEELGRVEIQLKAGRVHNEVSRFRYDVTLHFAFDKPEEIDCDWMDWQAQHLTVHAARLALLAGYECLGIENIPNARVARDVAAWRLLAFSEAAATVAEFHEQLVHELPVCVEPEDIWSLASECGYIAELHPSRDASQGTFDAVFRRVGYASVAVRTPASSSRLRPLKSYANDPLRAEMERRLTPELHTYLVERVPEYMVPSAFVLLGEMPLGTAGKVDRKALPAPDQSVALLNTEYVPPQSDLERDLAAMWADLLHIERVGTRDNFFEAGGHSLLATQVVSRVRQAFNVELPLRAIFEDPTVVALSRRIMLLRREGRVAGFQMSRVSRSEELATSFAQQRLWFLDQLESGQSVYNVATVHRLRGALEIPRLERAIKHVIARQESLRTTFVMGSSGQPIEVIHPELAFSLVVLDSNGDEAAAREWIGAEAQRPFDLAVGPLLRATLVRLGADDHVLEIIMHHIVSDGWSHGVLWHEIKAAYEDVALPELEILYADYAAWQRDYLASGVLEDQLSYWRTALAGAPAALELPLDHTRPALQTYNGKRLVRVLPKQLLESIRKLSHQEGVTLFMAMLAAWDVLLARYTGQGDIVIGTPIAGRNRAELEPIIGFFVNTLVMRTDMSGAPSFREVLNRVRETTLGAYANQDVPFERLVEELKPVRDMSRSPLFQVMIALHNTEQNIAETIGGVEVGSYGSGHTAAKFDLLVDMSEHPDGLRCSLIYNTDLFEAATAERMLSHFEVLLRALVADPATCCAEASILSSEEQRQLSAWNATEHDVPRHVPLHRHFEAAAAATPQAVAVRFEDAQLSYDELDRRANQLAQYLGARGIGPGSLVGVCAERSLEMVIALLGILKAGAGYVPIDPEYPLARLQSVIEDTATPLLLTQEHLLEVLPAFAGAILCLDRDWKVVAEFPATALAQSVSGKDVAYAIYTSGSTGKPKGVPNTHEGIVNRLLWMQHEYGLTTADRILQKTPYSFDVSVWEFFWPLMQGAGLVMARPQGHKDPDYLIELIQQQGITTMHFVPSMLRVFLEARGVEQCSSLKRVICSGEALPHDLTVRFFERLPGVELHNLYGPTEAAVDVTYFQCRPDDERSIVPIGRPVWNTQIHILSAEGQVQPVGVPGELYIAGIQLARGYLNRPDLTAERFVPNPFDPGSRMYKTGDLCRWLADGNIEYLGRLDHQVKVRGFRIELGEIEATLRRSPLVNDCVVIAREDEPGDKRLAAYIVPASDSIVDVNDIRMYLGKSLPDYMVPAAIVVLDALPLSANGKVDRKALPAPDYAHIGSEGRAPETAVQQIIAAIWADVLRLDRITLDDDFFQSGGHSLLATRVVAKIREAFRVEIPLRDMFENATVAELAERVEMLLRAGERSSMPSLTHVPRDLPLPLSFAQQRLWFLADLDPGDTRYSIPRLVRLRGALDVNALQRSLDEVVRRHEVLRTTFAVHNGQPVQIISPSWDTPIFATDISHLPEQQREAEWRRLSEEEIKRPFDLSAGPLLRPFLWQLGDEDHVFLINMHHIVTERWSQGLLWSELSTLYRAITQRQPSPLKELPLQYADYAVWQRKWLQGEELEKQVSYWRGRIAGTPPFLDLPTDYPRPVVSQHRGGTMNRKLAADLVERLFAFGLNENATLFMTLLAAFNALLMRYTGQQDIVIGTVIAGRTHAEIERLIGFFVNTLVLRTDLSGDPSFTELVSRVKETTLGAYAHQDIPFEKLVEELKPERSLNRNPFFQVAFVYDQSIRGLELHGLQAEVLQLHQGTSVFDISWYIVEHAKGVRVFVEYDTDLFSQSTIERMLDHYVFLLEGAIASPHTPITSLPLLTEDEKRQQLIRARNDTAPGSPALLAHQAFERQAKRTPDKVAVEDVVGTQFTYAELDSVTNRIAQKLQTLGVGPDVLVALCMDRSVWMAAAVLGILKAGGAYLPLDPGYPAERLRFMLDDARPGVLLADATARHALGDAVTMPVYDVEKQWAEFAHKSDSPPGAGVTGANLAYIIYTSGSTGLPKGAMITHGGLRNYLAWAIDEYQVAKGCGAPVSSSIGFDATVTSLWTPLLTGGKVVMLPEENVLEALRDLLLGGQRFSLLKITPAHLDALSCILPPDRCSGIANVFVVGGEALASDTIRFWQKHAPEIRIINEYGPTETVVGCCTFDVPADFNCVSTSGTVPIGRPIANTQLYVLDRHLSLVPNGVAGELYIAGDGVCRGYLNRPELTAERFIRNPFSADGKARMYRTGDLCRWLADGNIEYLGRMDDQVKIRGFRIELGEVENTLRRHPLVSNCVAVAREDVPGDKRLVAYIVANAGAVLDLNEIRMFLGRSLPEYMIPAALMVLESLPLSPNGKVDRRALHAPEYTSTEGRAPETAVQQIVAAIWSDVLKLDHIALEDDFFRLGGHSLLASQVLSRIRTALNIELSLRTIFEQSTLGAFAIRVEEARFGSAPARPPLTRVSRDGPLPPSFAQQRMWLVQQLDPLRATYSMPSAIKLNGVLSVPALRQALNEIVRRHEVLRTVYPTRDDEPVQVILPHHPFTLSTIDIGSVTESDRMAAAQDLAAQEAAFPFDLARGPMFRFKLIRLSDTLHVLAIVLHHINTDGWSNGVLFRDLSELYTAALEGRDAQLPELAIQYVDYAVWQRNLLSGETLVRQLDFWRKALAGAPDLLPLPTDHERPADANSDAWAEFHREELPADLTASVSALAHQHSATPFMVLASAFYWLLAKLSHQRDIVIGTDLANRNTTETELLIGFFVNVLPIRARVSDDLTFNDFLHQNRESMLDAFAHQEMPFDKLVQELKPERSKSHNPLVQVLFVMQNMPRNPLQLPGLEAATIPSRFKARFDLSLFVTPGETLRTAWMYNTALFEPATVQRFASLYRQLVAFVLEYPDTTFAAALEYLTAMERAEIETAQQELKESSAGKLKSIRRRSAVAS